MRPRLALLLLLLPLACVKAPGPQVWDRDGVKVTLTETHALDEQYAEYRLQASDGRHAYCWASGALGSPSQRRAQLAKVESHDGYLFVPASCGGGNASKCNGVQAFSSKPALKWLGDITGRWDGENVVLYKDGVFFDTGDMLESNALLSHAESPRYAMAYTEAGQALHFDAARSWALNADAFKTAGDDAPGLLYRAGLAKLCGKGAELRAVQAKADKILNAKGRQLFKQSLAQVKTRDIRPNAFIPVGDCPSEKP